MAFCTECGAAIEGSGKLCTKCGRPAGVVSPGEASMQSENLSVRLEATEVIPADDADPTEMEGFKSFREITLARQLVHFRLESEEQKEAFLEALRAIGDLELAAPFPIRSGFMLRHYETSAYGEMEGYLYDEPLGPDRLPPDGESFDFVFWKDLRTKLWGKPADPATYDRWVLFSREEYDDLRKRLKF